MSSGWRRRIIRLPGTGGTSGTGRTGGTTLLDSAAGFVCSCGVGCEKKAFIPRPFETLRFSVSPSTSTGGRLLAIDDFLHYRHICFCAFMVRLLYDERSLISR